IKVFIEYGMLTDEKFCDSAMKFALLEDTDNKYYKIDDYKKLISGTQTDKEGNIIVLYATDKETQYSYINDAIERGYNVLLMNGQLDSHFIGLLENKLEKCRFVRVDSDVVDNLIIKDNIKENGLSQIEKNILTNLFKSQLPEIDKTEFMVTFQPMSDSAAPIVITQNEYMRRMKDMASMQPGMNFYSEMPDSFNLTLNTNHKIIKNILSDSKQALESKVETYENIINESNTIISELNNLKKNDKDLSAEDSKKLSENESLVESTRKDEYNLVSEYAATVPKIKQVIDLALLGNGMLKGADLNAFLKRSIQLL
ncbi:MAG: molecular chaperone HtpG, partial [Muribaculaceae bacterium]|nr:molecular chaperone HtpG [Muribaculaceae bacterium]